MGSLKREDGWKQTQWAGKAIMTRIRKGQVWNEFWKMSHDKGFPVDSRNDICNAKVGFF